MIDATFVQTFGGTEHATDCRYDPTRNTVDIVFMDTAPNARRRLYVELPDGSVVQDFRIGERGPHVVRGVLR